MERILTELTPECEITARMYAQGLEKKEIASMKCRAISTVNNQLQKAFEILGIKNGRELATILYQRISGIKLTMDFSPTMRASIACCLLCVVSFSLWHDLGDMKRTKTAKGRTAMRYMKPGFKANNTDYIMV